MDMDLAGDIMMAMVMVTMMDQTMTSAHLLRVIAGRLLVRLRQSKII